MGREGEAKRREGRHRVGVYKEEIKKTVIEKAGVECLIQSSAAPVHGAQFQPLPS